MSICLGVLWSTVCLQLCFKNQFYIFPSKAVPPNRVSTSFLISCPCSNGWCSIAVQSLVIQQTHKLQISRPRPSSWVLPCVGVLQHLLFQAQLQQYFPENKGEEFSHILVFHCWLEYKQREATITNPCLLLTFPIISEHRNPPHAVSDAYLGS